MHTHTHTHTHKRIHIIFLSFNFVDSAWELYFPFSFSLSPSLSLSYTHTHTHTLTHIHPHTHTQAQLYLSKITFYVCLFHFADWAQESHFRLHFLLRIHAASHPALRSGRCHLHCSNRSEWGLVSSERPKSQFRPITILFKWIKMRPGKSICSKKFLTNRSKVYSTISLKIFFDHLFKNMFKKVIYH